LAGEKKGRATPTTAPSRRSSGKKTTAEAAGKDSTPAPAVTGGSPGAAAALLSLAAAAAFTGHTEDNGHAEDITLDDGDEDEMVSVLTQESKTVWDEKESDEDTGRDASSSGYVPPRTNPTWNKLLCIGLYYTRK